MMNDGGIQWWQTVGRWEQFQSRRCGGFSAAHEPEHTMKLGQMTESKYLKQADIPQPVLVTISGFTRVNVAQDGEAPEHKWTISFVELDKPMVLNSTNIQLLGVATGTDDTDEMVGRKIVVYTDPNVSYGGKLVGGLRIRASRQKPQAAAAAPAPAPVTAADPFEDDDIPF